MSDVIDSAQNQAAGAAPLREAPFKVTNPERIPPQRYYDKAFYDLECEHLWPKVWQMACRLEEIPEVGDYAEYVILGQSVFVVRTRTGIKAFHNACRHRGVKLLTGQGNCAASGITCPFHGWRWNMDGQNTFVFFPQVFSDENLQAPDLGLVPCRVELWGGGAFINFDDDAPPLSEAIKPFASLHDPFHADKQRVDWWMSTEVDCNWKIAVEAFLESYHNMRTHPQFYEVIWPELDVFKPLETRMALLRSYKDPRTYVDAYITSMVALEKGERGMIRPRDIEVAKAIRDEVELPADLEAVPAAWYGQLMEAITTRARAQNVPMPDLVNTPPISPDNFCFPNYFLLPFFGNMASYRIRPLGPEKCLFEIWSLSLYPEGEQRERPTVPTPIPPNDPAWPEIPTQDFANMPLQQAGLKTKGFGYMRLARDIEGGISNYHRVIDAFIEGVAPEGLLKGMQNACAILDQPLRDTVV